MGPSKKSLKSFQEYGWNNPYYFTSDPQHRSRESCGVWVIDNEAWKVFSNTNQWNRIDIDYGRATAYHLPTPGFRQVAGRVTDGRGLVSDGFALIATHVCPPAQFFNLKKSTGRLKSFIKSITSDSVLETIELAFDVAMRIGLKDAQGFFDKHAPHPVLFIDIHTSNSPASEVRVIYNYVIERRAALRQQRR